MTIKEALEVCCGDELKQEYVDKVMKKIQVDDSESTAIPHLPTVVDRQNLVPRERKCNNSDKDEQMTFQTEITWSNTSQKWKETTSGWTMKGELGAQEYAQANIGFEYHQGKTEKDIDMKSLECKKVFECTRTMKKRSSCEWTVAKVETEYTADIKKLRLKFPHDTKLRVRSIKGPAGKKKLAKVLQEKVLYKKDKDDNTIVEIDGKFKAMDIMTELVTTFPPLS